jgi:hypothetical protein
VEWRIVSAICGSAGVQPFTPRSPVSSLLTLHSSPLLLLLSQALFDVAAAAVQANPSSVDVYHLGALYNAAVMTSGAKLPEQVWKRVGGKRGESLREREREATS